MSKPDKEALIASITSGRKQFEQTLARFAENDLEKPILHDGWSVKDTLGHLAFWEASLLARLETLRAGGTPEPVTDMDALNARTLAHTRQRSLAEVRQGEAEAYRQLLETLQGASADELFTPGHFAATGKRAFAAWVPGETWEHYEEHLPEMNAWLAGSAG